MNKISSGLKINIDGKSYPVIFNSDGLIANISGKYYIYYVPSEDLIPYLGLYNPTTKTILQSGDSLEELRKIKYAFNNLIASLKVDIYGSERNVSLVKVKADSYGNERADYSFLAVDAGYFSIYTGFNGNMLDQSYTRTYIEFKSKEKLEKDLNEIKTALDKACR
jgi:hypothetical protein